MEYKLILPLITLITPIVILATYFLTSNNRAIKYFIPHFLSHKQYPKVSFRQAGTGCVLLSLWLIAVIASVCSTIDFEILEKMMWLMALLCFVMPIISVMFFCIGIYYLIIGVFTKSDNIKPKLQSIFAAEKIDLKLYVEKLKFYTILNLTFLFAGILSVTTNIIFEKYIGERLIPFNVLFLIGFILTLWRMRAYITKTAIAMDLSGRKYFLTTLSNPVRLLFVWIYSFKLIKMHKNIYKNI